MARVLIPETPLAVASTNVADSVLDEWSGAGVAYTVGQQVQLTTGQALPHHAFEVQQDHTSSASNAPAIDGNAYWIDLGAINRHAMFDGYSDSRTVATDASGNIVVELTLSTRLHYLALLGTRNISAVRVEQRVGGDLVADNQYDLRSSAHKPGWWNYLFGRRTYRRSLTTRLYGNYKSQTLTLTLTGAPTAEIAQCLVADGIEIGATLEGGMPRLRSWSTFERRSAIQNYRYVARKSTRTGTYTLVLRTSDVDRVFALMEDLEEDQRLVVLDANNGDTSFDCVVAYGKVKDFAPGLRYGETRCDIKIEGNN